MKNLYATLFLLSFGLIANLSAQTLKNIHRHNQPVLRIPTHLIEKVETAEVNGTQVLQVRQFNGYVSEIPLSQIDSITHSEGEAVDPAQLGNLRTASVMGVVSGPTGAPEMNAIVRSPYGGEETRTDPNGVFFLNNILVYDKLGYITITKPGFHQGSRSFLPLENGSNRVNVQLLPMTQSGTFSAASGGTVTSGSLQLTFPANAIVRSNGMSYTGTVNVYATALDPLSTSMFNQMPGELLGGLNDSLRLLRSFGMANIELRDANMNKLKLANGVSATLRFNIPTDLQTEAPVSIDWWSFDESLGFWKHEGQAIKEGSQYVGSANHFSWWNCDIPEDFNNLYGTVNMEDGTPVLNAQVKAISPSLGIGITYTNEEGVFTGRVPKNQQIELNVNLFCNTTNNWALAHSEIINSQTQAITSSINLSLGEYYPITGIVLDCEGQPLESGYVKMGPQIFLITNGNFTIQTCQTGEYSFRGYNTSNIDSIKVSEMITIQVGNNGADAGTLETCSTMFGLVSDIEGNVYETVLIGDKWWMAENLNTSHFSNGAEIFEVQDSLIWNDLSYYAWCYYNNDSSLGLTYGKLYNWYTTVVPSGLCPVGWHVPSIEEFNLMVTHLGGSDVAGTKLKTTTGWNEPSLATNESLFSALPGGYRASLNAEFEWLFYRGTWWSSTQNNSSTAYGFALISSVDGSGNWWPTDKNSGYSIRCVKN
jgi:uncharacterized protein (TIGR02145 family)